MTVNGHYIRAEELLKQVDEMGNPTLPISRALVAQANVHALLANCPERMGDVADGLGEIRTAVTNGERL